MRSTLVESTCGWPTATLCFLQVLTMWDMASSTCGCSYWRGKPSSWLRSPSPIRIRPMPGTLARMSSRFSIASVSSIISMTSTSPSGSSGQTSALLGVIALYSPKHTHDPLFLSNYVTINVIDQIKSTFGVGDATLWGPQDYSMRVWVRTDRLTGLGLTTGDIINAIRAQNVQAAVGRVGARPISNEQQLQLNIQTQGRLSSVAELENIVVRTNPDGSVLRLSDVARVELGAANLDRETRLNGGPASAVAIYQTPGANAIATLKAVPDKVGKIHKPFH